MFRILGTDGSIEGPIGVEVLRQRLLCGQLSPETHVQRDGTSDWLPLSELPELADSLRPAAGTPPPLPSGSAPPPSSAGPLPPATPPPLPLLPSPSAATRSPTLRQVPAGAPPHTSALAIASLILGALGLCTVGVTALLGVPFSLAALWSIRRRQAALKGRALAWTGLGLSVFSLVLAAVALGFLLPFLARMNFQSRRVSCVNNLKQVALAVRLQADEHDGKFPPAATWSDAIQPHLNSPNQLRCPDRSRAACGYAYNRSIAGRTTSSVAPETVMLFESDTGWNATIGPDDRFIPPPHGVMYSVAFADGSVREITAAELSTLRWEP